ncbi:hypothetical protein AB4170_26320, partial [Vibrio splendidus]
YYYYYFWYAYLILSEATSADPKGSSTTALARTSSAGQTFINFEVRETNNTGLFPCFLIVSLPDNDNIGRFDSVRFN